jgi:hypothetical protein
MSERISEIEIESKLSLVVRKPQEGKTTICITSIVNDKRKNIHVVLTMNALASNMQFFGRMIEDVGPRKIIVFNSKRDTAGDCYHAKNVDEVFELLEEKDIKVIVCCAHEKRIRESLPKLFKRASDSIKLDQTNIKFSVHIDEAHVYIPSNLPEIKNFNGMKIVSEITGYTATPDGIWSTNCHDELFYKILIRDVESELAIIRSPDYFGVKRCSFNIYEELSHDELVVNANIDDVIPTTCFLRAGMTEKNRRTWYNKSWYFNHGNELLFLSFVDYILPRLSIPADLFSYHFVPAYTRKATHYQTADLILKHYPTANVIIMNSNGYELCRWRPMTNKSYIDKTSTSIRDRANLISDESKRKKKLNALLEPSYMIQKLIKNYRDCPTFVTGFYCVGMSVTLINPVLGNFDNVIMAHQHFGRDILYQLCRFLFKYEAWSLESREKIKVTQFHSLTKSVVDTCLEYEAHVEKMCTDYAGRTCTIAEIRGEEPEAPSDREIKLAAIDRVTLVNPGNKLWRRFKVWNNEEGYTEEEVWPKVNKFYEDVTGNKLKGVSMPKKNEQDFYESRGIGKKDESGVRVTSDFTGLENEKWTNRFLLRKEQYAYARVFVGYDNLISNSDYTIFVKYAQLEDTDENREFLDKYATDA